MVSSMNRPWLYEGVTMLTRGQGEPPGRATGSWGLPSVQGQPGLAAGGGGNSVGVGQRTLLHPFRMALLENRLIPFEIRIDLSIQIETLASILSRVLGQLTP